MTLIDTQGRLFGKVSILDAGAALVILLVIVGIVFAHAPQVLGSTKPVEVDVVVRGLQASHPHQLFHPGDKANLIIRNQPYGQIGIKAVQMLPRTVAAPQPNGSLKALPDPRPEMQIVNDFVITLAGNATMTKHGPVLGNSDIKVGTQVELEGFLFDFNGSVIDVRI